MTRPTLADVPRRTKRLRCTFCGRGRSQVRYLMVSPDSKGCICDVCILLAMHGLADAVAKERDK